VNLFTEAQTPAEKKHGQTLLIIYWRWTNIT